MSPGQTLWNVRLLRFKKFFAIGLTVSFTLAPIGSAFAQEDGTGTIATDTGTNSPPSVSDTLTPPPAPELSIPGLDSIQPPSSDSDATSVSAPSDTETTQTDTGGDTDQTSVTPSSPSSLASFGTDG